MGRNNKKNKFTERKNRDDQYDAGGYRSYEPVDQNNQAFEEYYRAQGIISEDEWAPFLASLRAELPMTFRITGSRAHAEAINDIIKATYVPTMQNVQLDGVTYDPPKQLEWYPGALAWHMSAPKRVIRKALPFKAFQRFLVGETEVGNLSRQEAVSMIPPLFLDVQPHHRCLDMCAAPGSKTAQIIEALNPHHSESDGVLIANDSDYKRTHLLVHQTGRMPSKGLMVTNFDASMFPNISLGKNKIMQFDRILADVPCSGDGTLRKNTDIWKKWGTGDGNSLHGLQLRILERAMNMLKPGGRLVYSTCSFNPIENEAVIAAALNSIPGFHLVDVSTLLPTLKRRPGLTSWKVSTQPSASRAHVFHASFEDYLESVKEGKERLSDKGKGLGKTCWAPENAADLNLERCMRLLPHDQDTGGFFVCVLEKESTTNGSKAVSGASTPAIEVGSSSTDSTSLKRPASPLASENKKSRQDPPSNELEEVKGEVVGEIKQDDTEEAIEAAGSADVKDVEDTMEETAKSETKEPTTMVNKSSKRDLGFKEDPFGFVDPDHAEVKSIIDWFHLGESFPKQNLVVRNEYGDPLRTIYLTNDIVKTIIQNNDYSRLRLVSAGVKAFVRQDSQNRTEIACKWRIPSEGILEVLPHVREGVVVDATLAELRVFCELQYPPIEKFSEGFQVKLNQAEFGNMLVRFAAGEMAGGMLPLPLHLPVWKARTSMSLLVDKREKSSLSLRTFGEDLTPKEAFKKTEEKVEVAEGSAVLVGEVSALEEEALNQ